MSNGTIESTGFLLHSRRFRENSRLVDVFTADHGRVSLVARVSGRPGSVGAAQLQPFRYLLLRWRGQRALKNLQSFEALEMIALDGEAGICGLYCNEVLLRLLPDVLPLPGVFHVYRQTLQRLAAGGPLAPSLRRFEWQLLSELGYLADLEVDCLTGAPLADAESYYFLPGEGFSVTMPGRDALAVSRGVIEALRREQFDAAEMQREFRSITTAALQPLLGSKPLQSRKLMQQLTQYRRENDND